MTRPEAYLKIFGKCEKRRKKVFYYDVVVEIADWSELKKDKSWCDTNPILEGDLETTALYAWLSNLNDHVNEETMRWKALGIVHQFGGEKKPPDIEVHSVWETYMFGKVRYMLAPVCMSRYSHWYRMRACV